MHAEVNAKEMHKLLMHSWGWKAAKWGYFCSKREKMNKSFLMGTINNCDLFVLFSCVYSSQNPTTTQGINDIFIPQVINNQITSKN